MKIKLKLIYKKEAKFLTSKIKFLKLNTLSLSPNSLNHKLKKIAAKKVWGVILVEINNINQLELNNFNFIKIINVYNPCLSLKINNINRLSVLENITASKVNINNSSLVLLNSQFKQLCFDKASLFKKNQPIKKVKVYLFNNKINELQFFKQFHLLKLNKTTIGRFILEPQVKKLTKALILNNSKINRFNLAAQITTMLILKSSIDSFIFYEEAKIKKIKLKYHIINKVYNCKLETITNKNRINIWELLMNSARNSNDRELYAQVGYKYMEHKRKKLKNNRLKIVYYFMNLLCGYGYRPLNTIITSFFIWFFFGVVYFYLTYFNQAGISLPGEFSLSAWEVFAYSLYYSAVTFTTTGYGDITPESGIIKLLSGVEAALGIVLLSTFIFALTERFGRFK